MSDQPKLHRVVWNAQKIANFWDLQSQIGSQNYYSHQLGAALVRYVRRRVPLRPGRVLDFGCGPGFLLEKLAPWTDQLVGCDVSSASIQAASARSTKAELSHQRSVPTDLEPASFRVVWLVETIEHLLPEQRHDILNELRRLITADGWLIVTTPNREPLEASQVVCPDCGCAFHRYQHLSRWDAGTLATEIDTHGFRVASCRAVHLTEEGRYSRFRGWLTSRLRGYRPNLIYIGRAAVFILMCLLVSRWGVAELVAQSPGAASSGAADIGAEKNRAADHDGATTGNWVTKPPGGPPAAVPAGPMTLTPELAAELVGIAQRMRSLAALMAEPEPDVERIGRLQRMVLAELSELLAEASVVGNDSSGNNSSGNDSPAGPADAPPGSQPPSNGSQATASGELDAVAPPYEPMSAASVDEPQRQAAAPAMTDAALDPSPRSADTPEADAADITGASLADETSDTGRESPPGAAADRTLAADGTSTEPHGRRAAADREQDGPPTTVPWLNTRERVWGHLPDRLRQQIESRPVPSPVPAYRKSVERYFERLAELEP